MTTAHTPIAHDSPIVVGGSGGSGTRLVARLLRAAGVFIGADLNAALDNLTFTLLFKHPYRFEGSPSRFAAEAEALAQRFVLHERIMLGGRPGDVDGWRRALRSAFDHARHRYNPPWALARLAHIARGHPGPAGPWGWKEPQSMFFMDHLVAHHPEARFVLVLRNGLDMAYARHDQQFFGWARRYDLDPADTAARNRWAFWYHSNCEALQTGQARFGDRFFALRLEALCLDPVDEIQRLFRFLGAPMPDAGSEVFTWPRLPASHGRHRRFDTAWIDAEVRAQHAELGFDERLLAG